ncbi:AHH domain-containing protein [Agarilytica rhodophyticola]|uniref:AHH domain-containing protein n=1 Tax=Agarilytica rhodophyticola TaxID=1737490 RepID=UPI000CD95A59|nr:AHH domain-containing protein [Agarilytica rhodophyticola]
MFPDIRPPFSHVERLLADFAKKDKPTIADFAAVGTLGVMYDKLDQYRMEAMQMSTEQLKTEKHKSSRLAEHMRKSGDPRPSSRCDCHAIVSGGMRQAIEIRAVMAWLKVRIDDPVNGCWLPRDWDDRAHMPNHLRSAVPHRRIHHRQYYLWLASRINVRIIKNSDQLINALRMARRLLQSGAVPPSVMPRTGR